MKWLIFWTADKDMNSKWKWSTQLDKKPKRLKKNLKKFRLDRESSPDLSRPSQANWRASHCKFLIYPMVGMTWMEIFISILHFLKSWKKTTLADILVKYIYISIHILCEWYCSMDRALCSVIAKNSVRFPVKPEFFQVLFQPLSLFVQLWGSFPLP